MAQTFSQSLTTHAVIAFLLTLITAAATAIAAGGGGGISLPMFHRYSPLSPYYPGNLTDEERLRLMVVPDQGRISSEKQNISGDSTIMSMRPMVREYAGNYMVSVTIGTAPGRQTYNLHIDTGSDLTWIQCQPCRQCFPQKAPLFNPTKSVTCVDLPGTSPICAPPAFGDVNGKCQYRIVYSDHTSVSGKVKWEKFWLRSTSTGMDAIFHFAFGCTEEARGIRYNGEPAGVFGLNRGAASFATQILNHFGNKFSYCLIPPFVAATSYLRFGDDIRMRQPVQRTRFLPYPASKNYHLRLTGISLNTQLLDIPQRHFQRHDGLGGVIIDSGREMTFLIKPVYKIVKKALHGYLRQYNLPQTTATGRLANIDLCYKMPKGFEKRFPPVTMTFNFEGAPLQLRMSELFFFDLGRNIFCWMMGSDDQRTFFGAFQQMNRRFTYDLQNNELQFSLEDCTRDERA